MAADIRTGKSWRDFYQKNIHLCPAFDRIHAAKDISTPLCIGLNAVEGLTPKSDTVRLIEYQICVSLYDLAYRQFFGRQWKGPYMGTTGGGANKKQKLKYNQNIYFHTSINNPNIVAVIEIVAMVTDDNGSVQKISRGWGLIRIFQSGEDLPDATRSAQIPSQKIQLNYGSPRALYFMDDPIEDNEHLRPIPDCQVGYTVATHKAMLRFLNLLPENTIIGNNDMIPGLQESQMTKDKLKKPKLLQSMPCSIDGLAVQLNPSVDEFEKELCEHLHQDRLARENRVSDGSQVSIVERRLQVGVHNGWCYVENPQTFHLELQKDSSKSRLPSASPSARRSQKFIQQHKSLPNGITPSSMSCLVLKNRIQLSELLQDPFFAVVFNLEYVIGEPVSENDLKTAHSLVRGHTRKVTVRWGAWNPFFQPTNPQIQVALMGGPSPAPEEEFVYKLPDTHMQNKMASKTAGGLLSLNWSFQGQDGLLSVPPTGEHLGMPMGSMQSVRSEGSEALLSDSASYAGKPPSGKRFSLSGQYPVGITPRSARSQLASDMGLAYADMLNTQPISGPMSLQVPQIQQQMAMQQQQMFMQQPQMSMQQPQMMQQSFMQQPMMPQTFPQPQMYMPMQQGPVGMYPMQPDMRDHPATDLLELPYTPAHAPIMTPGPRPKKGHGMSRAAYARLYSVGFPPILDHHGEAPEVIDPLKPHTVDLKKEQMDPLQCNEIVFQFLAFAKKFTVEPSGPAKTAGTVFFTFQFYRHPQITTERLMLTKPQNELTADSKSMPFILHKIDKDGTLSKDPPGLKVSYYMDPSYMKPGENPLFLQHLSRQMLHIDVWDGDSLLLIGSTTVELKYICRGGHGAVQTTFELDVIATEYQENPNLVDGDMGRAGGVQPVGVKSVVKGKIHLLMANIGHRVDLKLATGAFMSLPSKRPVIVTQMASLASNGPLKKKNRIAKASHLAENNREVASLLFSNKQTGTQEEAFQEADAEKQRKLARVQVVRQSEGLDLKTDSIFNVNHEKAERTRDLKTIEVYRTHGKRDGIHEMLSQSISTEHVIHPSFGTAEFFEFELKNPFNVQQTITLQFEDRDLHVIRDSHEWMYFKQLYEVQSPMEEGMFSKQSKSQYPEVFLRPKETVYVPFKYLSFAADQSVQPQGPQDPFRQHQRENVPHKPANCLKDKVIKINFKGEDGKALAILNVKVEPQPHIVDQTFRFHHPEQSFLKKSVRLPPAHTLPGAQVGGSGLNQAWARCSDPNVICESKKTQPGEPQDVFLKVALGASPQIKRFFMAVYTNPYMAKPDQIWQFYVHALQRVDVASVEGQTNRFSLLLRGTQASRLVRCFASHPQEIELHPNDQFMLAGGAVHELNVAVRPLSVGNKFFYINVVDVEHHQLIRTWLVCVNCRPPMINRAFELVLPVGGGRGSSKRITYTNPYPHKRVFLVYSNRDDLVQFKESRLEIEGGETAVIGLKFTPVGQPGTAEILVFVNDEDDKNEETFKVNAKYQLQ